MPSKITAYGLSDIGLVRQNNEDVWASLPKEHFFVLADGMGGHQAGEIASKETVNELCKIIQKVLNPKLGKKTPQEISLLLSQAIQQVNSVINKMSRSDDLLAGMGTTLCCVAVAENAVIYAHVGDSRIYLFRDKKLIQVTRDHSLLRELTDSEQISGQSGMDFLYKNIITKAVGTEPSVEPDVNIAEIVKGDVYLMCTDGLSDLLSIEDMQKILNQPVSLKSAASALVKAAKERGGYDNITVVLVKV